MDQKEFSEHIFQFLIKSFPEFIPTLKYGNDNSFDCSLKSPSGQFGMWIATYNSEITFGLESPTGETDIHTHVSCDELDDLANCLSDLATMINEVKTNKTIMYRNTADVYDWADYSQLIQIERKKRVNFPKLFWSPSEFE
ncbi:MAG TPA: hypothetical protein PL029_05550 [Bacteroidia bacterium]|nr:hypothetical protein [Bacteroidia bacterium]